MKKKWLTRISILIMTWPVQAFARNDMLKPATGNGAGRTTLPADGIKGRGLYWTIKNWWESRTSQKECVDCSNNFGGICKDPKTGEIKVLPPCMNKSSKTMEESMQSNLSTMQQILFFIYTASIIISMGSLIVGAIQLAMAESNPHKREKAWGRIKISLIVLACLGGIGTVVGLAMSVIS